MEARDLTSGLTLPADVKVITLESKIDHRGQLIELYRHTWLPSEQIESIQWNYVRSFANVLRGVHLHRIHTDYLILLEGKMLLALRDVRSGSPTEGLSCVIALIPEQPQAIIIPPGLMHGLYFPVNSVHIYGVNKYWNIEDELGCQWNDPDLELSWSLNEVILSERDIIAPSFKDLMKTIGPLPYTPFGC